MQVSASRARLHLRVGSSILPVLSLTGQEGLSEPFEFQIDVLVDAGFSITDSVCLTVITSLTGKDGAKRELAGVITSIEETGLFHDGRRRVKVQLESRLALLRQQTDTRIILGKTVVEIITDLLLAHGFSSEQLHFRLTRNAPVRPFTLQAGETDFAFLQRLTSAAGIFYWSDIEDDTEILRFCDHNCHVPFSNRPLVRYQPATGMEATLSSIELSGIRHLEVRQKMIPAKFHLHDRSELQPALVIEGSGQTKAATGDFQPEQTKFASGLQGVDEAHWLAQVQAEQANVEGFQLLASSDMADLAAGQALSLDAGLLGSDYSGDYLAIRVHHRGSQKTGESLAGNDLAYSNQAWLIPRETPYRAALSAHPKIPTTFTARIESDGPYAQLDESGRYRLRTHFDREPRPHTEASIPIRRLSPYGGPPGAEPTGLHFPLLDGAEVLLSCLNGDPDRPMIVGALPNPANASPVTSANPHQNRLRTAGDNELCFDDKIDEEAITLRTFGGQNILHLNAAAIGHKVRLASEQGAMQLQAKKTMHLQSDATITERSGDDRVQIVENRHQTATNKAEIHYQAATDYIQRAAQNICMHAGGNIEQTAGGHLRIDVEQGKQVTVAGAKASFTVQDGNLHLQAAKDIKITGKGGGNISFGQSGGGFVIKTDGSVQLYGKNVSLKGGGVSLNGHVNYSLGAGPPMPGIKAAAPLTPRAIAELLAEEASPQEEAGPVDIEIHLEDLYGNQLECHFELIKGLEWQLESDSGEVKTGTVEDKVIRISQVDLRERFTFSIEDLGIVIATEGQEEA